MAKMGRPRIEWDQGRIELFNALMGIPFATEETVADCLKVSRCSLQRFIREKYDTTFETIKLEKKQGLHLKLAGKQYEVAMKGSVPMLIWLGKQWLGQRDKFVDDDMAKEIAKIIIDHKDANL